MSVVSLSTPRSSSSFKSSPGSRRLIDWFKQRGWQPAPFQRQAWRHYLEGESGLLHTPTGSGKTLAVLGGPLIEALDAHQQKKALPAMAMQVLWITPLRALALDTVRAIREALEGVGLDWQVVLRTSDATARDKRLARSGKAQVMVLTPESLALLLSYPETLPNFSQLRCIVVDEWHELLGSKRGVLLQLGLARLRATVPAARVWGLSATIGNLAEARAALLPHLPSAVSVGDAKPRRLILKTLLPDVPQRLPWAGQLGLSQLSQVLKAVMSVRSSLLFTNTRAHAELWHQALQSVWPEDLASLALHHGSLDGKLRAITEQGLRLGTLRCVVATSSLDLGVDFPTVDQVLQIGSPKGVARLLQRAGRAHHHPGGAGRILCVPAQALDLVEYAATRRMAEQGLIEARSPLRLCIDVLAQHCITLALGGGFEAEALYREVRATHAFADLSLSDWQNTLNFIVQGGQALSNYPDYHRVVQDENGIYRVTDKRVALRHRLSIGTITADGGVLVQRMRGGRLGTIEESFISRLKPGDRFKFAGQALQLVRFENMTAYVRNAKSNEGVVPTWQGGRLPLSPTVGREVERLLDCADDSVELKALAPLRALQARASALPSPRILLIEVFEGPRGQMMGLYPFAGRAVHEGLAALLALRLSQVAPNSISFAVNDYGLMLTPAVPIDLDEQAWRNLMKTEALQSDLKISFNLAELARRQFREIARVTGLLPPSLPGRAPRSLRQLQVSSGLLFDVLRRYDPDHILLAQAEREVFETTLDITHLSATLEACNTRELSLQRPAHLTPLAFSLWAEHLRGQLSTEDWQTRIRRAAEQLEKRYGKPFRKR